jgi:hypothetical protein
VYQGSGAPSGETAIERKLLRQWPVWRVNWNGVRAAVATARIAFDAGDGSARRTG